MCGITGVLYRDGSAPSEQLLSVMATAIAHRGPDGQGVKVFPGCGLAHRRLSIIDLSTAASQPMASADERVWVAFNGEIYNYLELRAQLEQLGHTFRTKSDTETILAAWRQWGTGAVARLDGMFAIALWDTEQRVLLLARDRTGKKPLFVYEDGQRVVFGSEVKAILEHPSLDTRMREEAPAQFLAHGYVPTPHSFWERIRKIEPATFEVHALGSKPPRIEPYWEFGLNPSEPPDVPTARAEVRRLFLAAVKRRLLSDVPLGAFLSGGIDSTLVVAAMAQASSGPVKTFSIGFEGQPQWDETEWARLVAERYGTEHTEFKVSPQSFELIEKLAWHYDEPFGDSSAIPTAIVSQLTRQKVTVALTGDGGDELFAGYPRFAGAVAAELVPPFARKLGALALGPIPPGKKHGSTFERVRRFAMHAAKPLAHRLRNWVSVFPGEELETILTPQYAHFAKADALSRRYDALDARTANLDAMNRVLFLNARTYLLDDLNVKMDRASMAFSLETRAPFLDTQLMDYVSRLPGSMKLRGVTTKWILKTAMNDLIPEPILTRKKMGFGVPLGAWFRGELRGTIRDRLLAGDSPLHRYVKADALSKLAEAHDSGRRDLGLQFWSLWMLELWLRRHAG